MTTAQEVPLRDLSGVPNIVDGDTLIINGIRIRLEGIDAPETD
jgi:endonuclease YncB( thermonuclease family)